MYLVSKFENPFLDSFFLKNTFKNKDFQGIVIFFLLEIVYFLKAVNLKVRLMFHRHRERVEKKNINISKKNHLDQGE